MAAGGAVQLLSFWSAWFGLALYGVRKFQVMGMPSFGRVLRISNKVIGVIYLRFRLSDWSFTEMIDVCVSVEEQSRRTA